jgi:hypothetical protein
MAVKLITLVVINLIENVDSLSLLQSRTCKFTLVNIRRVIEFFLSHVMMPYMEINKLKNE